MKCWQHNEETNSDLEVKSFSLNLKNVLLMLHVNVITLCIELMLKFHNVCHTEKPYCNCFAVFFPFCKTLGCS